jgi:2-methylcitrate dehydratase PrpD
VPSNAAFINAYQIHCQEFDCVHEPAVVHPMATILAALLAECDANQRITGQELGTAVVVSVDLAVGLGVAANSPLKFFRPATAGIFGASLGICKLRRYDDTRTSDALGYALSFASGTMQAHAEGKQALPVQIGHAARCAHFAADLAGVGFTAAGNSLEGKFGYLPLFEDAFDLAPVIGALQSDWRISEVSHKVYPTGRAAQGGLSMMERLRAEGVSAPDVQSIILRGPPLIPRLVGRPARSGMDANYARLCFPYLAAKTLLRGPIGLEDFDRHSLSDAAALQFSERITVSEDHAHDPAAFTPQTLEVHFYSGTSRSFSVDALPGSPRSPLTRAANEKKFRRCAAFGFAERRDNIEQALISAIENLETLDSASILSRLAAGHEVTTP